MSRLVVVLGSSGMLGHMVMNYFKSQEGYRVLGSARNEEFLERNVFKFDPLVDHTWCSIPANAEYVINCIGTIKPHMLKNLVESIHINAIFPHKLANRCRIHGSKLIHISTDCFLPSTKVLTNIGYKPIQNILVDDLVYSHRGNVKKTYKLLPRLIKENVYAIKTLGNDVIKCTKNHPWFSIIRKWKDSPDFESVSWNKTFELSVGSLIAIPKLPIPEQTVTKIDLLSYSNFYKELVLEYDMFLSDIKNADINIAEYCRNNNLNYKKIMQWKTNPLQKPKICSLRNELELNEDLAWFFGLFLAEGWVDNSPSRKSICISLGDEPQLIDKVIHVIDTYFRVPYSQRYMKGQYGCQITFTHQTLSEMLSKDFYVGKDKYSHTKKVPSWVTNAGKSNIESFLKGYFDGDGCFYENDDKNCFVSMSSVSEELIDGIKTLFMLLGILPSKTRHKKEGASMICAREVSIKDSYVLTISGNQLNLVFDFLGITSKYFNTIARYQRFFQTESYWFVPITDIEEEYYEGFVYNLEVKDDHSYLINGGLSAHNCVFSGAVGNYDENALHDATDEYGKSKSLGEPKNCMIIRTSIIGTEIHNDASLIAWIQSQSGKVINGFTNHFWNGVTTLQFAKACDQIIKENLYSNELFHIYSSKMIDKFELLSLINEVYEVGADVVAAPASTPIDRTLQSVKPLCENLNIPDLKTQLQEMRSFGI